MNDGDAKDLHGRIDGLRLIFAALLDSKSDAIQIAEKLTQAEQLARDKGLFPGAVDEIVAIRAMIDANWSAAEPEHPTTQPSERISALAVQTTSRFVLVMNALLASMVRLFFIATNFVFWIAVAFFLMLAFRFATKW